MLRNNARLIWIIFGVGMLLLIGVALLLNALTPDTASPNPGAPSTPETGDTNPALTQPAPSPSPLQVPDTPTITVSGIEVQNFLSSSQSVDSQGTVLLRQDDTFTVLYFPPKQQFLISITGSPFEKNRQQAETFLLAALNVPEEQACRLTVEITTPGFANPNEAGKTFGLSFCN